MYKPILINDNYQNWKGYSIQKAQLIIADVPYTLGNSAYASNPKWYVDGDNRNGESELAGKQFFDTEQGKLKAFDLRYVTDIVLDIEYPWRGNMSTEIKSRGDILYRTTGDIEVVSYTYRTIKQD